MFYLTSVAKKSFYFFIALILVLFLFSPDIQKKPINIINLPVGTTVYYLQIVSTGLFDGLSRIWDDYINLVDVQEENGRLHHRIAILEKENNQFREKVILAERLKSFLEYKEHSQVTTTVAAVIGRQPSQWFDTMMINKGSLDGIQNDMGVITPQGIVGKIIDTQPRYAQVLLISDRNSAIGAIVQRTRDEGVIQGIDSNALQLKYLPHDSQVSIGDLLVTSGMEGSFTKGLIIGHVENIEKGDGEMFLKIRTTVAVDVRKIEEVMIIQSIENEP